MKRAVAFAISIIFVIMLSVTSVSAEDPLSQSWYCVRNKDHKQPIADSDMRYIEEYNGYYIDHAHGDESDDKVVYLTFDAGYENGNVEKILDVLKQKKVTGAFFVLGNLITKNTDLVIRMTEEGHLVCNHTESHPDMTKKTTIEDFEAEPNALQTLYSQKTGKTMPKYYRPPEGRFNKQTMVFANELGYKTIFWSLAYADWDNNNQMSPDAAMKKILDNIHNGAVILLHPTSKTNADILPTLIKEWRSMGYDFGTLDDLTL